MPLISPLSSLLCNPLTFYIFDPFLTSQLALRLLDSCLIYDHTLMHTHFWCPNNMFFFFLVKWSDAADYKVTSYNTGQHLAYSNIYLSIQAHHHYCQPFYGDLHGVQFTSYTKIYLSVSFLSVCLFTCLSLAHCSAAVHPLDVSILSVIALFAISSNVGFSHMQLLHHFCLLRILIMEINISIEYVCSPVSIPCVMYSCPSPVSLVDSVWISVRYHVVLMGWWVSCRVDLTLLSPAHSSCFFCCL